jgi:hypothetical protein
MHVSYVVTNCFAVDSLPPCSDALTKPRIINPKEELESEDILVGHFPGLNVLDESWWFPFTEDQPFVLTITFGPHGYHIRVDGNYVCSFLYNPVRSHKQLNVLYTTESLVVESSSYEAVFLVLKSKVGPLVGWQGAAEDHLLGANWWRCACNVGDGKRASYAKKVHSHPRPLKSAINRPR